MDYLQRYMKIILESENTRLVLSDEESNTNAWIQIKMFPIKKNDEEDALFSRDELIAAMKAFEFLKEKDYEKEN